MISLQDRRYNSLGHEIERNGAFLRMTDKNKCRNTNSKENWLENFKDKWAGSEHFHKLSVENVEYVNNATKVDFLCSEHGDFRATPGNVMARGGCPKCVNKKNRVTTEIFIERAKKIHGDRYDYSASKYIGMNDKISIICKEHGEFQVRTANHTHPVIDSNGKEHYSGCQKCSTSWRFKVPDKGKLMKQIIKESKYRKKRAILTMEGIPYVEGLLTELITTGVYMVKSKDIDSSKSHQMNIATQYSSKLTYIAIDIITEPLAVSEEFLIAASEVTLKHIAYLATKFRYVGTEGVNEISKRVDKLKEPAWKLVDACQERLGNGNKQICVTRKLASAFL